MENEILSKVRNVRRQVIEKKYNWGLYVYKKSNGSWFTDGDVGNCMGMVFMLVVLRFCTDDPQEDCLAIPTSMQDSLR